MQSFWFLRAFNYISLFEVLTNSLWGRYFSFPFYEEINWEVERLKSHFFFTLSWTHVKCEGNFSNNQSCFEWKKLPGSRSQVLRKFRQSWWLPARDVSLWEMTPTGKSLRQMSFCVQGVESHGRWTWQGPGANWLYPLRFKNEKLRPRRSTCPSSYANWL